MVFALDDSGSILQSGMDNPMMNAIGSTLNSNPDVKYARVDWHNPTFDYASSQFYPANYWPQVEALMTYSQKKNTARHMQEDYKKQSVC